MRSDFLSSPIISFIGSLLAAALIACDHKPADEKRSLIPSIEEDLPAADMKGVTLYEDINLYRLEGIKPLAEISFPAVQVTDSGSLRIVKWWASSTDMTPDTFTRVNDIWMSYSDFRADTSHVYDYVFLLDDRLINLTYTDTVNWSLMEMMIIKGNSCDYWIQEEKRPFCLATMDWKKELENFRLFYRTEVIRKDPYDGYTRLLTQRFNKEGFSTSQRVSCYHSFNRSAAWFHLAPWALPKETVCLF